MTEFAYLIACMEGFWKTGSRPQRNNNPGDLRHGPNVVAWDNAGIAIYDTVAEGWSDLERQLQLFAQRNLSLEQAIAIYAPGTENDTNSYIDFICSGLHMEPGEMVATALLRQHVFPPAAA